MEYQFNSSNVCKNPEVIYIDGYSRIELALHQGQYIYGYVVTGCGGGEPSPCSTVGKHYDNRLSALNSAYSDIIENLKIRIDWYDSFHGEHSDYVSASKYSKKLLSIVTNKMKAQNTYIQLSLF